MTKQELIESTGRNELLQFLGVRIEIAEPDRAVLTMEVTTRVHQYVGIMNGGVSLFLCETAASIGAVLKRGFNACHAGRHRNQRQSSARRQPRNDSRRSETALRRAHDERLEHRDHQR